MKWSFKLGRFLGIDVFVHFTFLIVLAIVGIAHWLPQGSLVQAFWGMVFFALLFLCVLLHEYGHALMARRFGVGTRDITLLPIGGVARLERIPEKPSQELLVALAGPAVNVVIALGLAAWLTLAQAWEPVSALGIAEGGLIERLLAVNIGLVLFNLLPAFPMDGGRVLRAVLAMKMDYARATSIAATVGKGMAIVFAMAGLIYNPMLILIAVFVWSGAAQEASMAQVRAVVSGACVREAMVTRFHTVPASATLQDLAALMLSGAQHDYPPTGRRCSGRRDPAADDRPPGAGPGRRRRLRGQLQRCRVASPADRMERRGPRSARTRDAQRHRGDRRPAHPDQQHPRWPPVWRWP